MASRIPLKCDICPKKPRFSDVSHLLTHISSKTHLSNTFKARVRLEVDTEARRLIEDYDQWYAEWNIQDLLAERMSQKENKVTKPRARGGARGVAGRRRRSSIATSGGLGSNPQSNSGVPIQNVDPSLFMHQQQAFQAARLYHITHPNFPHAGMQGGMLGHQQHGPYGIASHSPWSMLPPSTMQGAMPPHIPAGYHGKSRPQVSRASSTAGRKKRRAAAVNCDAKNKRLRLETHDTESRTPGSVTEEDSEDEDEDRKSTPVEPDPDQDAVSGTGDPWPQVILKGVTWSGMGCFDAAEPHQRSQRNQKKTLESYMLLCRSSSQVADAPFEVIFKMEDDDLWLLVKSRVITGNPSPSSIASSSPARSRRSSLRKPSAKILKQRFVRQQEVTTDGDDDNELAIHRVVFGLGRPGKLPVFKQDDEDDDDDAATDNTFAHRPRAQRTLPIRATWNLNKENERLGSVSAATTAKTDQDEADTEMRTALPSIEGNGHPSPTSRPTVAVNPTSFLPSSPNNAFSAAHGPGYPNGSAQRYGATIPSSFGAIDNSQGYPSSRGYLPSLSRSNPPFGLYAGGRSYLGFGGHQNGTSGMTGLDNLATVASQDYYPSQMFATPNLQASPSNGNTTQFHLASPNAGQLTTAFQTADWSFASPMHPSFGHHGRYSSQSWGMTGAVPPAGRGESTDGHHHTDIATGGFTATHSSETGFGLHPERWASTYGFSAHDSYGITGGPDSKASRSYGFLPSITPAPITGYGFGTPTAMSATVQPLPSGPVTPTRMLMPPPTILEAIDQVHDAASGASSDSTRAQGHHGRSASCGSAGKGDRDTASHGSSVGSSESCRRDISRPQAANKKTATASPTRKTGDPVSDEDRTVTAPGTPPDNT